MLRHAMSWFRFRTCALAATTILGALSAYANVKMPKVFGDNMVLQREAPVAVWGWADPGESVSVSFGSSKATAKADAKGAWKLELPAQKVSAVSATMTIKGKNEIVFSNILVGDVWLCSGQSNMEMGISAAADKDTEVPAANNPMIRLFKIPKKFSQLPEPDLDATWKICTPENVVADGEWGGFSAVGYYFGKSLNKSLNVPIGLIDASWGGTMIEPWCPPVGFSKVPALSSLYEKAQLGDPRTALYTQRLEKFFAELNSWLAEAKKAKDSVAVVPTMPAYPNELLPPKDPQVPTALFNGMLNPLVPFALKGSIWYQGEANHRDGKLYIEKTRALVEGWRTVWNNPKLGFYFVQIAPFEYGNESPNVVPEFWEAQTEATSIPYTGMAVTTDIATVKDIHPPNKKEVGRRLALLALNGSYGRKDIVCNGPKFKSMKAEGSKLRVSFDNAAKGLASRDGKPLDWFEIIDAKTGGFVKAAAAIDGSSVVLSSPEVKSPVAVRFGWSKLAEPNLMNGEGLPAISFRAGEIPSRDQIAFVPESKGLQLVYDLDLSKLSHDINYNVDNRAKVTGSFDRIAYMLELESQDGASTQYLFVSMDAFTDDLGKIGIPTIASGASFQTKVGNMNVYSNVPDIATGLGLKGGNIEFWPNNYGPENSSGIPNASNENYDFGDQPSEPVDGYGSMQVHNCEAKQTLFAINHWVAETSADIGIGNRPDNPNADWTFAGNAQSYGKMRLRVFVHCK